MRDAPIGVHGRRSGWFGFELAIPDGVAARARCEFAIRSQGCLFAFRAADASAMAAWVAALQNKEGAMPSRAAA